MNRPEGPAARKTLLIGDHMGMGRVHRIPSQRRDDRDTPLVRDTPWC